MEEMWTVRTLAVEGLVATVFACGIPSDKIPLRLFHQAKSSNDIFQLYRSLEQVRADRKFSAPYTITSILGIEGKRTV